jgi:HSP20 family protein
MRITPLRKRQEPNPETGMAWPRLRDRMDRLFQNVFAEPWREFVYPESAGGWMPDVDVKETDRGIEVVAELPGMDPAEIQISAQGNTLTISGEKREELREEKEDYYFSEIHYGSFQRVVELPDSADPDQVSADYDKGVLRISVGKKAGAAPRRIAVKGGSTGSQGDGGGEKEKKPEGPQT